MKPYRKKQFERMCTMCGQNPVAMLPIYDFYKGVKVRIQLCVTCAPNVVKGYIDSLLEGRVREMEIDKLSKFHQK